jgi:aerobic carbon-monoxide dehydrogenase large subunit
VTVGAATRPRLVGQPVARREDDRILRGHGRYLDDIELPHLAHAAFVRSPHAHARITAIRAPKSDALLVLTAADLGGRVRDLPVNQVEGVELADAGHPILASDEVLYVGQPVALVVAETRALAEDLAELVEVDYEPLDPVLEARDAPELLMRFERTAGDIDGAFAAADHIVRTSFRIPRLVAVPIETRGAVAEYDPGTDLLTVHLSA